MRMFGPPLAFCLAAQLLSAVLVQQMTWSRMATAIPASPTTNSASNTTSITNGSFGTTVITAQSTAGTATVSGWGFRGPSIFETLAASLGATLTTAANFVALSWFGMWMGLNSKNTNLATLKTIAFVQIIPWFIV